MSSELAVSFESHRRTSRENFLNKKYTRSSGNWRETVSSSLPSAHAKQAWKNGAEKLSQTINNVKTSFVVLSQRIKKSSKKKQPPVKMKSPKTPITPYTRSKAVLGRTPTKLYSPFTIDTPTGKEVNSNRYRKEKRFIKNEHHSCNLPVKEEKKKFRRTKLSYSSDDIVEANLSNNLLQAQI